MTNPTPDTDSPLGEGVAHSRELIERRFQMSGTYRLGPWRISHEPPPIPVRDCDWHYQDDNEETRGGSCPSLQACLDEIWERIEEEPPAFASQPAQKQGVGEADIERIAREIHQSINPGSPYEGEAEAAYEEVVRQTIERLSAQPAPIPAPNDEERISRTAALAEVESARAIIGALPGSSIANALVLVREQLRELPALQSTPQGEIERMREALRDVIAAIRQIRSSDKHITHLSRSLYDAVQRGDAALIPESSVEEG